MRLLLSSVLGYVLVFLVHCQPDAPISTGGGGGVSKTCSARSNNFHRETKSFLNCLGDKIQAQLDLVKPSRNKNIGGYVRKEKERMESILKKKGCNRNIGKSVSAFLRDDMKASKVVYDDIVKSVSTIIWETAKAPRLAECFLDFLREKFLSYIKRCSGLNIPTKKSDGLNEIPTLSTQYDLKSAREVIEYYLKAYLAAYKCKITDQVRDLSAVARKDVCYCASKRYTGACLKIVRNKACTKVNKCIRDIPTSRDKVVDLKEVAAKADYCWKDYKRYLAQTGRSKTVKIADLVDPAQKLASAFGRLSAKDIVDGLEMIQAFLNAQFGNGFCGNCFK